jgi:hypothetical protein
MAAVQTFDVEVTLVPINISSCRLIWSKERFHESVQFFLGNFV